MLPVLLRGLHILRIARRRLSAVLSGCGICAYPAGEGAQGQDKKENPGRVVGAAGVVLTLHCMWLVLFMKLLNVSRMRITR